MAIDAADAVTPSLDAAFLDVDATILGVDDATLGIDDATLDVDGAIPGSDGAILDVDGAIPGGDAAILDVDAVFPAIDVAIPPTDVTTRFIGGSDRVVDVTIPLSDVAIPTRGTCMEYTSRQIVEVTGVSLRTIRLWIARGIVPKPRGKGPGTRYLDEHRVLIRTVLAFRQAGTDELAVIRKAMRSMPMDEMRDLIGEPPAPSAVKTESTAEAEPARSPRLAAAAERPREHGATQELDVLALPASASRISVVPLLPHLALMVGEAASPVVRRIAAEICERYGQLDREDVGS